MPLAEGTHFIYTVRPNDTLYSIARRLGSTVEQLEQLNALYPPFTDPGLIFPGQMLIVPYQYNPATQLFYFVNPSDTLYSIATRFSTSVQRVMGMNPDVTNPNLIYVNQLLRVPGRVYRVSTGDSLGSIANQLGVSVPAIIQANQGRPGFSPDVIYPGYGLIIPQ